MDGIHLRLSNGSDPVGMARQLDVTTHQSCQIRIPPELVLVSSAVHLILQRTGRTLCIAGRHGHEQAVLSTPLWYAARKPGSDNLKIINLNGLPGVHVDIVPQSSGCTIYVRATRPCSKSMDHTADEASGLRLAQGCSNARWLYCACMHI